jgi:hypothetical protein
LIHLTKNWPTAELRDLPNGSLEWRLDPQTDSGSYGSLWGTLDTVSLWLGSTHVFEDFIIWYRDFVPLQQPLYLFNSSDDTPFELTANTTVRDVRRYVGWDE